MLNGVVEAFAEFSCTKKNFLMLFGRFRGERSIRTLCQVLLPRTPFRICQIFPSFPPTASHSLCVRDQDTITLSVRRIQGSDSRNPITFWRSVPEAWSETSGTSTACSGRNERVTLIYLLNENNPSRDFSNLTNSHVSGFSCYFNFVNRDFAGAAEKIFVDFVDGRI
jgi:hypothetical protein